eukprot:2104433-Karenia_brevis.AAC.1
MVGNPLHPQAFCATEREDAVAHAVVISDGRCRPSCRFRKGKDLAMRASMHQCPTMMAARRYPDRFCSACYRVLTATNQ